jgi:TnpA family transposase
LDRVQKAESPTQRQRPGNENFAGRRNDELAGKRECRAWVTFGGKVQRMTGKDGIHWSPHDGLSHKPPAGVTPGALRCSNRDGTRQRAEADTVCSPSHRLWNGASREILGRSARSASELLQVYGCMLAHGSMLDATAVSLMIPELSPAQIEAGMQFFEDGPRVRLANDCVASFQRKLPVTALWGAGTLVSADMMSLDVSRKIWAARLDPKRKVPSVGTYTHLSDFWSLIFDQPIVLNERQAGAAIEGIIRQREIAVKRLAVDTHGYTDFAMAQGKFLGFAVCCHRFKRLSDRKLHAPRGTRIPKALADVVVPTISLRSVAKHWDDLIRIAASILTGQTSAVIALARFGSAALGDPIYRAGVALGRLLRSLYLIDYFTSEPLRREVNRILVHGESVHHLQRAIHTGSFVKPRGQRHEELTARSG